MYAVVVSVRIPEDRDSEAEELFRDQVLPGVKARPGFVSGTWARSADPRARPADLPARSADPRVRDSRHSVSSFSRSRTLSSRSEYHSFLSSIKFSIFLFVVITPDAWPDPGTPDWPRPGEDGQ